MKPPWVFHPFLLALYPPLLLYTRNTHQIYPREILVAVVVILVATLAVWTFVSLVGQDRVRSGLLTSGLLFVIFSFERNVHVAQIRHLGSSSNVREWLVLGAELVAFAGGWFFLFWFPRIARPLNTMGNAGSILLLGFLLPGLIPTLFRSHATSPSTRVEADRQLERRNAGSQGPDRTPDIYWIVLDGFGRSDVLRSFYQSDLQPFLERMEQRGFYVARQSTSNYCQTALSIPATLNATYHDDLAGSLSESRLPLRDRVRDASTLRILQARGYKLVSFASGFGLTDGFPADERRAPRFDISEFNGFVLDMTPLWTILGEGAGRASHRRHRERILNVLDHLADITTDPKPTFCFAHIVAPHPPFVFDAKGRDVSGDEAVYRLTDGKSWSSMDGHGGSADYARRYREQAAFLSDRVERVVDQILARSPEPPVILIQGDHGPASHFDLEAEQPNDLLERMSILNLSFIPGAGSNTFYPTITPVNTFRVLFDHLFKTNFGRLPDRNYYSSYRTPYQMFDVTGELSDKPTDLDSAEVRPAR